MTQTITTPVPAWVDDTAGQIGAREIIWLGGGPERYVVDATATTDGVVTLWCLTASGVADVVAAAERRNGTLAECAARRMDKITLAADAPLRRAAGAHLRALLTAPVWERAERLADAVFSARTRAARASAASLAAECGTALGPDPHTADLAVAIGHVAGLLEPLPDAEGMAHRLLLAAGMALAAPTSGAGDVWSGRLLELCAEALTRRDCARLAQGR